MPDELLRLIHTNVRTSLPDEREGVAIYEERLHREGVARGRVRADPPVRRWQMLGFRTLNAFLAHVRAERRREDAARLSALARSLPEWKLYGFPSSREFKRARRDAIETAPD